MDIMELGAIGELVGGVAVIGTLLFIGMQIRYSNRLAQGASELEMGRMNMDYLRLGAEGDLAPAFYRTYFTPESASQEDKYRFVWALGMWTRSVQAMYRQRQLGLLPEASWNPLLQTLSAILEESDVFAEPWESNSIYLAEDFRELVDGVRARASANEFWQIQNSFRPEGD